MEKFIENVALMRRLQKEYFKDRNIFTLRQCKSIEREVDDFLSLGVGSTGSPVTRSSKADAVQPSLFQ